MITSQVIKFLKKKKLPSFDDFYNKLHQEYISWADYQHAEKVRFFLNHSFDKVLIYLGMEGF